ESVRHGHTAYPGAGRDVRPEAVATLGAGRACDQAPHGVAGSSSRTADVLELFALDEVDRQVRAAGCSGCRTARPGCEQHEKESKHPESPHEGNPTPGDARPWGR